MKEGVLRNAAMFGEGCPQRGGLACRLGWRTAMVLGETSDSGRCASTDGPRPRRVRVLPQDRGLRDAGG